jgi:hypothetical protein
MIGVVFLFTIAGWCVIAFVIALGVARLLPWYWIRWFVGVSLFAGLLILPLGDEITGGREFAQLCRANSAIDVNQDKAIGRTVYEADGEFTEVAGTNLPVFERSVDFIDADTGEKVLGFRQLKTPGGGLSEALRFSETHVPLTFDGECNPGENGGLESLFEKLHITRIKKPK